MASYWPFICDYFFDCYTVINMKNNGAQPKSSSSNLESLDRKLSLFQDQTNKQFQDVNKRFSKIDKRFALIDAKLKDHDKLFDRLIAGQFSLDERLTVVEREMVRKADLHDIQTTLDKMLGMMIKLDQEVTLLSHAGKRRDTQIESLDTRVGVLERATG